MLIGNEPNYCLKARVGRDEAIKSPDSLHCAHCVKCSGYQLNLRVNVWAAIY